MHVLSTLTLHSIATKALMRGGIRTPAMPHTRDSSGSRSAKRRLRHRVPAGFVTAMMIQFGGDCFITIARTTALTTS